MNRLHFFPDEQEREYLAAADPQKLAKIFLHQPYMLPGFLLELWRTNHQEDMFTALQVVGKDNLPFPNYSMKKCGYPNCNQNRRSQTHIHF